MARAELMLADAFGNAIGNSIVDRATPQASTPTTKKQSGGFDWEASQAMGADNFFGADVSGFASDLDFNPNVDFTPGMTSGDATRARAGISTELQRQLDVSPEQADQMAAVMQQKLSADGLQSVYMMGGSSGGAEFPWDPRTAAQQSAYKSVVDQGRSHSEASEVARLVATKEQIESLIDGLPQMRKTAPGLARQVEDFIPAFNNAMLSKDVYYDTSIQELLPRGFTRVADESLYNVGLTVSDLRSGDSGYFGAVYQDVNGGYVLANRGTEDFTVRSEGIKDWINNYLQGTGQSAPQYDQAIRAAQSISGAVGDRVSFTGHSLGGGLAMAQALVTNRHATVFNAAGVHANTLKPYDTGFGRASELISAYNVSGEMLSFVQDGGKYALAPLAPTLRQGYALTQLPKVEGLRFTLPAVAAPTMSGSQWRWGQETGLASRNPVGRMVDLHSMSNVIYSLGSRAYSGLWGK